MSINEIISKVTAFRDDRDWKQFHTPGHLAAAIAIEAAELQEEFLWKTPEQISRKILDPVQRKSVEDELADVLIYTLLLTKEIGADPAQIIQQKLKKNAEKYPVAKARGIAKKYNQL